MKYPNKKALLLESFGCTTLDVPARKVPDDCHPVDFLSFLKLGTQAGSNFSIMVAQCNMCYQACQLPRKKSIQNESNNLMHVTHLYLVRHGETQANLEQRWYGAMDAPLTARGERQVAATAAYFAESARTLPVDAFYVSPLPRAQSTAAAIAAAIGMTPVVENGLREFSIGDWEGRTYRDLIDAENLWGHWDRDPHFAPPNGESPVSFGRRIVQMFHDLVARHPGQTILTVSHGAVIASLLDIWLGAATGNWMRWDPHNCAVTLLAQNGAGWTGIHVNDIRHLPADAAVDDIPEYYERSNRQEI